MAYWSFDPRKHLRETIGTLLDYNTDGKDERVISVLDDFSTTIYIPLLYPGESRSGEPYPMPFIEMVLVTSPAKAHDVSGNVREQEGYIDMNIWYTNQDTVTATSFGKTVADKLVDLIVTNHYSVPSVSWMEPINDGREMNEDVGKMVVFHRIVEVYLKYFG
jgi:hypothetical protein